MGSLVDHLMFLKAEGSISSNGLEALEVLVLVPQVRLELTTLRLEGECSIH